MFPTEAVAVGWATLNDLLVHLNAHARLLDALQIVFGDFQDRIASVATIPEHTWRTEMINVQHMARLADEDR